MFVRQLLEVLQFKIAVIFRFLLPLFVLHHLVDGVDIVPRILYLSCNLTSRSRFCHFRFGLAESREDRFLILRIRLVKFVIFELKTYGSEVRHHLQLMMLPLMPRFLHF